MILGNAVCQTTAEADWYHALLNQHLTVMTVSKVKANEAALCQFKISS